MRPLGGGGRPVNPATYGMAANAGRHPPFFAMNDFNRPADHPIRASGFEHTKPTLASGPPGHDARGPIALLLDVFSSIWLGVTLLSLLFIYSAMGSSGVPTRWNIFEPGSWETPRFWRWIELNEFEWFHWWPFKLLIALICITLVTATLRRIKFNALNFGVWMIHTGIIVLALGSVWYFSTKVEGEAPVNRRRVVIELPGVPGEKPVSMLASPGNSIVVGKGDDAYGLQIAGIDPQWELLSGEDKGKKSYKVSVMVQSKGGMFIRELIANRPEYTQDLIRSDDPQQPFARAVKKLGKPLVDEAIKISLEYDPQSHFYLMDSRAVYLREVGQKEWVQRAIHDLPRYNDYIAASDDVWQAADDSPLRPHPITDVEVPPQDPKDPLPNVTFRVSRYLRYANLESRRRVDPNGALDPQVIVRLNSPRGDSAKMDLVAFDPAQNNASNGKVVFAWVSSNEKLEQLKNRTDPIIRFTVPGAGIAVDETVLETVGDDSNLAFKPIAGTVYSYRVQSLQDNLMIGEKPVSIAIIELRSPQRTVKRWVFDDGTVPNRDMAMTEGLSQHDAPLDLDQGIAAVYRPGNRPPAPIMILAGPGENDLGVMVTMLEGQPRYQRVQVGETVPLVEDVTLTIDKYAPRTLNETKPFLVPREQRDRDVREMMSMIRLDIPLQGGTGTSVWLPYHHFPFSSPEEVLRRFSYRPQTLTLADGRQIEIMFSRERLPLPAPVVLDDFQVASHIGGFTGQTSSIMDWISMVRFANGDGLTEPMPVKVNHPAEFRGYWFFQAQWDPPDSPRFQGDTGSRGLNYTVLGVGNRNGVNVQLAGACIAVLGMIYAFYVKPILKRRRQAAVYAESRSKERANIKREVPVGAAWKVES